jgi:hypothetical protein
MWKEFSMYTAVLRKWIGIQIGDKFKLKGEVYGDAKKRFAEGELITTSAIDAIEDTTVGKVAVTASGTRYLLVG